MSFKESSNIFGQNKASTCITCQAFYTIEIFRISYCSVCRRHNAVLSSLMT